MGRTINMFFSEEDGTVKKVLVDPFEKTKDGDPSQKHLEFAGKGTKFKPALPQSIRPTGKMCRL